MAFGWRPGWRAPFVLRVVGLVLFVVAYFLPAVRNGDGGAGAMWGWSCAYLSLNFLLGAVNDLFHGRAQGQEMLIGASGLINLLVPGFLVVRGWAWKWGLAVVTTLLVVVVVPAALHVSEMKAIAGCYLWLGGTLVVLVSEFVPAKEKEMLGEQRQASVLVQDLHKGG
jgi:hypothetical protein